MQRTVNQDSGCTIILNFLNENKQPVVPVLASYIIKDVNSMVVLKDETVISEADLGTEIAIEITPSINALRNQKLEMEPKSFTISWSYFNGKSIVPRVEEFIYNVIRLYGRSTEGGTI